MNNYKIVIKAGKTNPQYWRDLWSYRELFFFLAWRDVLVRYKQTAIGIAWSVIRPLLTMIIFTIVFGKLAEMPSGGIPYPVLVYAAMLPWQFFSNTLSEGGNSLINNTNMVTKVYFPRIIIPTTSVITSLIDFLISLAILACIMIFYSFYPGWQIAFLPLLLLLVSVPAMGVCYWVSALNVKYRDFRYTIPFMVQFGLYISPVGFSSVVVLEKFGDWGILYFLNPMAGIIEAFRWSILGTPIYWEGFIVSCLIAFLCFFLGVFFFRKMEREFADVI